MMMHYTGLSMNAITKKVTRYLESLRFPVLLLTTAAIFLLDLLVPDVIPFIDELLLALVIALLARMKRPPAKSDPDGNAKGEPG